MDLRSLLRSRKSSLRSCRTVIKDSLGRRYEMVDGEKIELERAVPFVIDEKPDLQVACVLPGLFLSSQDPPADIELLRKHRIAHVLSVGIDLTVKFDEIKYHYCDLLDLPESDILPALKKCAQVINKNLPENILVHCNAGVSRSPTIVIFYLMFSERLSFDDAYDKVKKARNCIKPNDGFVRQLKALDVSGVSLVNDGGKE